MNDAWDQLYQYLIDREFDPETVAKSLDLTIKTGVNDNAEENR